MSTGERFVAIAIILLFSFQINSYNQNHLADPDIALEKFNNRDYSSAYLDYTHLLENYPKDAYYNYYAGVCLYYLNYSNKEAVEYLSVATRYDVPEDVYFYLGRLHHIAFRFDEAIEFYEKYNSLAGKKAIRAKGTAHLIEMAYNGKAMMMNCVKLTSNLKDTVVLHDIAYALKNSSVINTIYTKNSGKDLAISEGPLPDLNVLNTPYDDDYACYDESSKTLYFSSKGHNSMGGYDVFSVKLKDNNTWGKVENIGFPVNSPFDEIFYKKEGNMMLATNRKLPWDERFQTFAIILNNSSITHIPSDSISFYADLQNSVTVNNNVKKYNSEKPEQKLAFKNGEEESNYDDFIKQALRLQFKSDSLMREAQKRRNQLKITTLKAERTQLFREIRLQEAESDQLQIQADALYAKAGNIEDNNNQTVNNISQIEEEHEYIQLDTIINDIKVYHYKTEKVNAVQPEEKAETKKPETKIVTEEETEKIKISEEKKPEAATPITSNFKILPSSAYSSTSPIPLNEPLPGGIIYKIQLGVFSKQVNNDHFGGFYPISGEELKDRGLIKYYAGIFSTYVTASTALSQIKANGFADAFVVSYYDGKKITVERAKELEDQK